VNCLPSLGILLINALTASDSVIVPVQMQKFALNGIIQLEEIFNMVKAELNTDLQIDGSTKKKHFHWTRTKLYLARSAIYRTARGRLSINGITRR
jgi:cellulose biosynthesis protein BcsQ